MNFCDRCRSTFEALEGGEPGTRALRLDEAEPQCRCECVSVSPHSPKALEPPEVLIRVLVAPLHVRKGKITSSALSAAETSGLSIFRDAIATDDQIKAVAEFLVSKARISSGEKAGVFGVLRMITSTVRTCKASGENENAYCVYDTALADNPSHAEVFQRVAGGDKVRSETRRQALLSVVRSNFVPVQSFRGGLLEYLAPKAG